jgi:hypothetical protein
LSSTVACVCRWWCRRMIGNASAPRASRARASRRRHSRPNLSGCPTSPSASPNTSASARVRRMLTSARARRWARSAATVSCPTYRRTRRATASRGSCPSTADDQKQVARRSRSLPLPTYSAPGGLRQDPGRASGFVGRGQNLRKRGMRSACGVVDVGIARRCRTAGGTRGGVAGTRCGGAGVRAAGRGVRGAAGACRRAAGAARPDGAFGGRRPAHGTWPRNWASATCTRASIFGLPSRHFSPGARPGTHPRRRPAAGGQRPRLRLHRPAVAGGRRDAVSVAGHDGPRHRADRGVDPARRPSAPARAGGVPGRERTTGVRGLGQHGRARPEGHRPSGH